jgi:hypothetical protein
MHLLSTFLVVSRVSGALLILSEQFWSAVRPFEHAPVALRRLSLPELMQVVRKVTAHSNFQMLLIQLKWDVVHCLTYTACSFFLFTL